MLARASVKHIAGRQAICGSLAATEAPSRAHSHHAHKMSTLSKVTGEVLEPRLSRARDGVVVAELNNCQCKSYVVADTRTGHAAIIDPILPNLDRYMGVLGYLNCRLAWSVETHTHADHISASPELSRLTGAEVAMHVKAPAPYVSRHFADSDRIQIGGEQLTVLHTPGHTPDSTSFYGAGRVFTGDALLIGGTGRTDFAGGDPGESYDSIANKLFTLPDDTVMLPAHDYRGNTESTIGREKQFNPRLAGKTREEYIDIMTHLGLPLPEKIMEALQTNAAAVDDSFDNIPQYSQLTSVATVSVTDLEKLLAGNTAGDVVVLDVREPHELEPELGMPAIPGSVNIPVRSIPKEVDALEAHRDKHVVCVCRAGLRSSTAATILRGLGFPRVSNLAGGMLMWTSPTKLDDAKLATVPAVSVQDVADMLSGGREPLLLDVRESEEFTGELGHIDTAVNVPLRFVPEHAQAMAREATAAGRTVVTVCRSGRRSCAAASALRDVGVDAINMTGGMLAWRKEVGPGATS